MIVQHWNESFSIKTCQISSIKGSNNSQQCRTRPCIIWTNCTHAFCIAAYRFLLKIGHFYIISTSTWQNIKPYPNSRQTCQIPSLVCGNHCVKIWSANSQVWESYSKFWTSYNLHCQTFSKSNTYRHQSFLHRLAPNLPESCNRPLYRLCEIVREQCHKLRLWLLKLYVK